MTGRSVRIEGERLQFWEDNVLVAQISADWLKSPAFPIPAGRGIEMEFRFPASPGPWAPFMKTPGQISEHFYPTGAEFAGRPTLTCMHCGVQVIEPSLHRCPEKIEARFNSGRVDAEFAPKSARPWLKRIGRFLDVAPQYLVVSLFGGALLWALIWYVLHWLGFRGIFT